MNFLEIVILECNQLLKTIGTLTIGFAFGSYMDAILNLSAIPFKPTAEFILLFCMGYLLVKIPLRIYRISAHKA